MKGLENQIKKKFEGFEVNPPDGVWSAIEKRLDQKKVTPFTWYKLAAAIALLLVAAYTAVYLIPFGNNFQQIAEETVNPESNQVTSPEAVIQNEISPVVSRNLDSGSGLIRKIYPTEVSEVLLVASDEDLQNKSSGLTFIRFREYNQALLIDNDANVGLVTSSLAKTEEKYHAQSEKTIPHPELAFSDKSTPSGFALSAFFSPQQSYRYQSSRTFTPYESLESELESFSFGLNVHYKVSSRFEVLSGLAYNRMGQQVNNITAFSHPEGSSLYTLNGRNVKNHPQSINTSMGGIKFTDQSFYYADVSSSRIMTLKGTYDDTDAKLLSKTGSGLIQHFNYLEIPLELRYKFIDRSITISAKAAVTANFLLSDNVYLQGSSAPRNPIGKVVDIYKFNWGTSAGLVFSYPLSSRLSLLLEPTASIFMKPVSANTSISGVTYPYNYSLLMGVAYDF